MHFLLTHKKFHAFPARFDVVSMQGKNQAMEWLKDAFRLN
jgi:Holliday junction resolvase-like predicted endonuclease